jgi:chromosome segregation ATPase
MNKAAKVLVVFMAFASLSFMAFSAAVLLGGPNWMGMGEALTDYTFEVTKGEKTTYSAKSRQGDPPFSAQSENPAEVVLAALKDQKTKQSAQEQLLDQQVQNLEGLIADRKSLKEMDLKALQVHEQNLSAYLANINEQISSTNATIKQLTEQSIALNKDLGLYREDVLRLRDQLELVRADRDRLVERSKELEDILALLKGSIGQMERRTQQLSKQQKYDDSVGSK